METKIIEQLCGEYPSNFIKADVISNPNYIFTNDTSYPPITLLDYDKNVVTVNSFLECEHYVSGGWDYIPTLAIETEFHIIIFGIAVFMIAIQSGYKKYRKFKLK